MTAAKKAPSPELIDQLLAGYEKPEDLLGEHGLLKQLTKAVVERALQAEMAAHLAPECNLIELLQDGLVEALADAVGLRVAHLGLRMLNVIQSQIQLIVMRFRLATILRASISQNSDYAHHLFGKERQHPVIQEIGSGDWSLGGV